MAVTNEQLLEAILKTQGRNHNGDAVSLAILDTRLDNLEKGIDTVLVKLDEGSKTFKDHESRITKNESRLGFFAALLATLALVGNVIAGWLGMKN